MTVGSLDGITVLELSRYQSGPRCSMILSDLGANVIKIERPGGEETRAMAPIVNGQSIYFGVYNRGKKSICLDLRRPEGKDVFFDLLRAADFVIENFRPGTLTTMGMDYESLCQVKPDIILLSASAFGQYGPYRDRPGFDGVGQAMSGLMSLTGQGLDRPVGTASSIVDRITALHLCIGALAALRHRDRTGEGQVIDVCLLDSALSLVEIPVSYYLSAGEDAGEAGRVPYRANDGWVVIAAGSVKMTESLLEIVNAEAAGEGVAKIEGPLRADRVSGADQVAAWCAERSVAEIVERLSERGIVVAPVLSIPEVSRDPHLAERGALVKVSDAVAGDVYVPGTTIKMSATPGRTGAIPTPGQDTDDILTEIGYPPDRIAALRYAGVL